MKLRGGGGPKKAAILLDFVQITSPTLIWTKSKRTAVFLGLLPLLTLLGILSQGISAGAFYTKRAGEKILSGGDNVWGDATPHLATIMDQTAVWISTLTTSHHSHQRCLLI